MINPINHGQSAESVAKYKVEPYVVAADVYSVAPLTGRGGWTWYTGSAGWMYRLIVESLLGIRLEGDRLHFVPCIPAEWPSYEIEYRFHQTLYRVRISRSEPGISGISVTLDGNPQSDSFLHLTDDGREHRAEVVLGM
jgi:cellobiose phosphorylase